MVLQDELERRADLRDAPAVAVGISTAGTRTVASRGQARFRIASLTKTVTSAAVVLALAERSIPLDTPAVTLLPGLEPDWRADRTITVAQLLGQVAGLREDVDGAAVAALGDGTFAIQEAARLVVRAGNARPPGSRWSYYNGNYFVAGALLAAVTGTAYELAVGETVLRPWGLDGTGFIPTADYPRGRRPSGGLCSGVPDLLTLGERLIGDATLLAETRRPRTEPDDPMAYGLGWALGPSGQLFLNGRLPGHRAALLLVPDQGFVAVALAADERVLPGLARLLSDLQHPLTGDDLGPAIDAFAA
ncbi:CubicO group peptidase, beta-lactamase class C family [Asanoa hainanensis]|uniref:CubicO group peptidase, beta-lactamase class C family n=1 Tax=Asanoa hainanensis TaxID=560556 RepID=A0A239FTN9_9ACTN|nr:serine hydrolase domain-containing protein [Asanoa hainanensis]SNS60155.1 CubicO group peptidase, beta-lactamase class C family [Asanoa hainanensis]